MSLPVRASTCRAFIVNFHAALRAAPPRMKARIVLCLRNSHDPVPRYVYVPLRSALNACRRHAAPDFPLPTAGLRSASVVAGQAPLALVQQPSSYLGVIKCAYARASKFAPAPAHLIAFIVNFHAALARGSTTHESQMAPCLRHSAICRRYSCFTFRLRRNPHSYRLVGKCPRLRTSKLVRLCVRLPSFHSKYSIVKKKTQLSDLRRCCEEVHWVVS